jgi:ATP-binding cassette subfamily F protein 3
MLQLSDITYRIGGRTLLDRAGLSLPPGARAGLVGRNGAGKTTLFRIIAGELEQESGDVVLPRHARIGQVAQEAPSGETALIDVVLAADRERTSLLAAAESETDPTRIAELHTRLADIDAHSAEARAASILAGLGFDSAAQKQPCSAFSGGWRMRVALAAVLFAEPDLLLLDEPTNYLDLEGALWLNGFLARYRHTVIVISHDRDLLDEAVDTIVHLDQGKLATYRGGYSRFDRQRTERQALQLKLRKKQQEQRQHLEAFVARFRAKASKAKQAQSRIKALERLAPIAAMIDERVFPFAIPSPARLAAPPIIAMEDVSVGYDAAKPVLKRLDITLGNDDRIGLLGKNGNGKSTLAKLLSGRLAAQGGKLRRGAKLRVGYFAQHQLDELDPKRSAFDHTRALMPDATEATVRARAGALGFPGKKMDTPAGDLSGGEKARLLLGLAAFAGVDLLVLDEPTNHLDIDSREALIRALNDFAGAVIIVSHDRHLLEATVDRLWLVADGTVRPYDGDLDDYRRLILGGQSEREKASSVAPAKDRRREAARKRDAVAPLRRAIKKAEAEIGRLHAEIGRIDAVLAAPGTYRGDAAAIAEEAKNRADALAELEATETRWLDLSTRLETLMADGEAP